MLLELAKVSKAFELGRRRGTLEAVRDVNLTVSVGEFIVVVGPSGGGKTTLLRLIAGLDFPTAGEVLFAGDRVRGPGGDRTIMFQSDAVFPWLTVFRNAEFGLRHTGVPPAERYKTVEAVLKEVGLAEFHDALPHQLSSGMKQRLGLARSLAGKPRLLLLDEPFSAIDAIIRVQLQALLRRITGASHTTTVLVTHDVEEAIALADRIFVLSARPGTIRCEPTHELLQRPFAERVRTCAEFQDFRRSITALLERPEQASIGAIPD
jgi:NitT/TauT family transport system ATP-binding protein